MRIAQVAPLYESVPPKFYGGTERVVSYLTEELVRQGHDVTLFAAGDSRTRARLVCSCPSALRLEAGCVDRMSHHMVLVDQVYERADEFDVIHFHIDYLHFPTSRRLRRPRVTTLHGRLDIPDLESLYKRFRHEPVISISNAQRSPLPWLAWRGNVYHGLPDDFLSFHAERGQYLAFLGRISPEKRVDRAIEIARKTGWTLKIAAKIDQADREYHEQHIEPLLGTSGVEYVGEIGEREKDAFLGNAAALLFPIDWPEPFGLVMIEALACGTPIIAWCCGSVPEIVEQGETGFICKSLDEAVRAVNRLPSLSRARCRQAFETRFLASRMAADYVRVYEQLIERTDMQDVGVPHHGRDHYRSEPVLHSGDVLAR